MQLEKGNWVMQKSKEKGQDIRCSGADGGERQPIMLTPSRI